MAEDIHWKKYEARFRTFPRLIPEEADPDVTCVICIPACAEPDVHATLYSLSQCELPLHKAEVILLFNKNSFLSQDELKIHEESWKDSNDWIQSNPKDGLRIFPVYVDQLPDEKGGVGWARKLAMDEAARRLNNQGIIICLDSDCSVSGNYLNAVAEHFQNLKFSDAASIFFEHKSDHLGVAQRDAIQQYELHLRYLIQAQQWCGHPFAYHTFGSAMAVRRKAYMDQGGMNTRRAGEDFYFLQKFIEINSFSEIRNTTVYPSARVSNRVPFGTGRAMYRILEENETWLTTDFEIFQLIRPLFKSVGKIWQMCTDKREQNDYVQLQSKLGLSDFLVRYLEQTQFMEECINIAKQTSNVVSFRKRFFRYFNAFRMMKYMHYMSDHHFPDVAVIEAAALLVNELKEAGSAPQYRLSDYLSLFRQMDRESRKY